MEGVVVVGIGVGVGCEGGINGNPRSGLGVAAALGWELEGSFWMDSSSNPWVTPGQNGTSSSSLDSTKTT